MKKKLKKETVLDVLKDIRTALNVLVSSNALVEEMEKHKEYNPLLKDCIVKSVSLNLATTPKGALERTGRKLYVDDTVVEEMPIPEKKENDVYFFKLGRYISDANLDKEYELRGLKPADPYSVAAVNEADPAFADEHPHGTHWKDSSGRWCFAAFYRWGADERDVYVNQSDRVWYDFWWFAGVRK